MRQELIERIYNIINDYANRCDYQYLTNPIPKNFVCGLYIFFDPNNPISNTQNKITYIGITKDNGNNRLEKHQKNGPSSFRDHVEKAIKEKYGKIDISYTTNDYIHKLPYLFFHINNISDLKEIEKSLIEIISNNNNETDIHKPNQNWLGFSYKDTKQSIKKSHIWNIQHTQGYSKTNNYNSTLDLFSHYSNQKQQ